MTNDELRTMCERYAKDPRAAIVGELATHCLRLLAELAAERAKVDRLRRGVEDAVGACEHCGYGFLCKPCIALAAALEETK